MRAILAFFVAFSFVPAHASNEGYELRQAITFLNGRVEVAENAVPMGLRTAGAVVATVGVGTFIATLMEAVPVVGNANLKTNFYLGGVGLIATGILVNVAGRLVPIYMRFKAGQDRRLYRDTKMLRYFLTLPLERQFELASEDPQLRANVIEFAESFGFSAEKLGASPIR